MLLHEELSAESVHSTKVAVQALIEASPLAIVALDMQFNVTLWSPAAERMFGWKSDEVLGRRYPLVPPERWTEVPLTFERLCRGSCLSREERIREHKTGRLIDVSVSTDPLYDPAGRIAGLMAIFFDLTDRKRAEEELRFANAILRTQQETSPDGILVVDDAGKIVSFNNRFCEMTGVCPKILRTRVDEDVLRAVVSLMVDPAQFLERVRGLYQHREAKARDEILLLDGRTWERYTAPMLAPDGKYYGRIWYFRDITERKRAEKERAAFQERLYQTQKMDAVGQLAGGVAHDFHNLLTVILGNLDLLQNLLPADPEVSEAASVIRDATEQAVGVTRSLLTFSRRLPVEKMNVQLQQIVENATRMLRRLLPASVEVSTIVETDLPLWVKADATQLLQVLMNLAINARDAMPNGGRLTISVSLQAPEPNDRVGQKLVSEAFACVSVSDTGEGIPESVLPHLFEPFYSTKPRGQGTGLGLAIIHGIIEHHGGRIAVESQVGKGSTFRIFLPRVTPEATGGADVHVEVARPGRGETIVVAEDDPFVRGTVVSMLQRLNYRPVALADGPALMQAWNARANDVQFLVLDIDLPGLRGVDCVRAIRGSGSSVPIILITGVVDARLEDSIDSHTVLLPKPFSVNQLGILISRMLGSAIPESDHNG